MMDKEFLKNYCLAELVMMQHDLRRFPEDKENLKDVLEEIKRRADNDRS